VFTSVNGSEVLRAKNDAAYGSGRIGTRHPATGAVERRPALSVNALATRVRKTAALWRALLVDLLIFLPE